ncbi:hypothetical protein BG004_007799 [Podila humilis]|nr:hypothetical protein BG004_007799 [Podila humilis]
MGHLPVRVCDTWELDKREDKKKRVEFTKALNKTTKNVHINQLVESLFEPIHLRLASGEEGYGLLLPVGNQRLPFEGGSHAFLQRFDSSSSLSVQDVELEAVLLASVRFLGPCRRVPDPGGHGPSLHKSFGTYGEKLAQSPEGILVQSGHEVLLALKAEVYGVSQCHDSHTQDLAKPTGTPLIKVERVHDNTTKIMIGTMAWRLLVTSAGLLGSGSVVVGPDNREFFLHASSTVWVKNTDWLNMYNTMERQVRSKLDQAATFGPYAAVVVRFNHEKTMPVTLKSLYSFKFNHAWFGLKLVAFIFKLYQDRKVAKADLETHFRSATERREENANGTLDIIKDIVANMADVEVAPVTAGHNNLLKLLATKLSGEMTRLNKESVEHAVELRIQELIPK